MARWNRVVRGIRVVRKDLHRLQGAFVVAFDMCGC
jgi:hypothetical protein